MLLYVDSQYASPYAMSAFVALIEKEIPFDLHVLNLGKGEHHAPEYALRSLSHRVPTLTDGDFSLSESSAIAEYLNDVFPGRPLLPPGPRAKAKARQLQAWLRSDLMAIRQERTTEVIFYRPVAQALSPEAQAAAEKLFAAASSLLAHGGDFLFDQWCIADVDLALMLNRLILNGDSVPEHLAAYAKRQWARPSVQQWVAMKRPPL